MTDWFPIIAPVAAPVAGLVCAALIVFAVEFIDHD